MMMVMKTLMRTRTLTIDILVFIMYVFIPTINE